MTEVVDELGNLSKEEGGNKKVKKSRGARKANLTEGGGNKKGYDDRRVATVDGMCHLPFSIAAVTQQQHTKTTLLLLFFTKKRNGSRGRDVLYK